MTRKTRDSTTKVLRAEHTFKKVFLSDFLHRPELSIDFLGGRVLFIGAGTSPAQLA